MRTGKLTGKSTGSASGTASKNSKQPVTDFDHSVNDGDHQEETAAIPNNPRRKLTFFRRRHVDTIHPDARADADYHLRGHVQ